MCGIFGCVCRKGSKGCSALSALKPLQLAQLHRRGPDAVSSLDVEVGSSLVGLHGTVLHMRGPLTRQPLVSQNGDALLWNGEVYDGLKVRDGENDSCAVLEELSMCSSDKDVLSVLASIRGPWAMVYLQASTRRLWFGRDVFGRRSLLWHLPADVEDYFAVTSVASQESVDCKHNGVDKREGRVWEEIPAVGVFCVNLEELLVRSAGTLWCYPWMQEGQYYQPDVHHSLKHTNTSMALCVLENSNLRVNFPPLNKTVPSPDRKESHEMGSHDGLRMENNFKKEQVYGEDKQQTVWTQQTECKQQTEGKKHTELAETEQQTEDRQQTENNKQPVSEFQDRDVTDNCEDKEHHMLNFNQEDCHCLAECDKQLKSCSNFAFSFLDVLRQSVHRRVHNLPAVCRAEVKDGCLVTGARLGILFSGGVDSVVMAALADMCMPVGEPIDLINVAFDQNSALKKQKQLGKKKSGKKAIDSSQHNHTPYVPCYDVPDRRLALSSLKELNPRRQWNLILVNVQQKEAELSRERHFRHLVYPLQTVLDDSIGCALWFAARGRGVLYSVQEGKEGQDCLSSAKGLLVGIGADEQLAGYSRHRQKYLSNGWEGLMTEVEMDVLRISRRNLGRDDRCIADHMREARFPFLDEEVVTFLQELSIDQKVNLSLPRGYGEKHILREVAKILGCPSGGMAPKQAIQFGSRSAKVTGSQGEQGSDVCSRLQ